MTTWQHPTGTLRAMNKRLITAVTAVLLVVTGFSDDGTSDDQFNQNAEKLTAKIAERRDGRVSERVSPKVVILELRKIARSD